MKKTRSPRVGKLIEQADRAVRRTISESRKDRGLSQEATAELMGWTVDMMGNIEKGRRGITVAEFIVVAKQLGLNPETMFRRVLKW